MARRGASLVELLVALLLLQAIGTAALATAFFATRLVARAQRGIVTDRLRREALHGMAAAPACRTAVPPMVLDVTLPATPERAALAVRLRCGGTSLLELLVALTLLGLVGTLAVTMLRGAAMPLVRITTATEAGRTIDALALLVAPESATPLGLLAAADGIHALQFARYVGDAPACAVAGAQLALALAHWSGERVPDPERDQLVVQDHLGDLFPATPTGSGMGVCPDGSAALWLSLDHAVPLGWVVLHEPLRLSAYSGAGGRWLGLVGVRSTAPIQPFAGPLDGEGLVIAGGAGLSATVHPVGAPPVTLQLATSLP